MSGVEAFGPPNVESTFLTSLMSRHRAPFATGGAGVVGGGDVHHLHRGVKVSSSLGVAKRELLSVPPCLHRHG